MSAESSAEFWIVGHRGSPTEAVENTLESFQRAVDIDGANGLEFDLSITRDGEIPIWHDYDPSDWLARFRRWGLEPEVKYRPFAPESADLCKSTSQLTLAELREHFGYADKASGSKVSAHIPTLEEVIAWAAHQPRLDITFFDVKLPPAELGLLPAFLRRVDACVERFRPRFRIVLESAHPEIIDALREAQVRYDTALDVEPSAGVVWDCDEYSAVRAAIRHGCLIATPQKPRSITLWPFETHHRIVAADTLEMRKYNDERTSGPALRICPFTINEPDEMRALLELGVSGMQSDRPALLKQTLDEVCSTTRKHDSVADVRSREASQ